MAIIIYDDADWNSFLSVADADTYFSLRLNSTNWTSAVTATKESALVTATRQIRVYLESVGYEYPEDEALPQAIADATCELAIAMLDNAAVQAQANGGSNIRRVQAGSASVEFFRPVDGGRFPVLVQNLLNTILGSLTGAAQIDSTGDDYCPPSDNFRTVRGYD